MSLAGRQVWNWREETATLRREREFAALRRRGLVQGLVVIAIGSVLNLVFGHTLLGRIVVIIGALQAVVAMQRPLWLQWFQRWLDAFGRFVGRSLAWILLAPLWLVVFVPVGLWLRLRGRDPLHRAPLAAGLTAWIPRRRAPVADDLRRQFLIEDREARALARPVGSLPDPALAENGEPGA